MSDERKYSFLEVKQKIEAWCAYRDRCHSEVNKKLRDYGLDGEDTNALLAHLISYKFLDEQRFADSFTSGKFRINKWGRIKIQNHLKSKFVPDRCIKDAMNQINEEEYQQTLEGLATRKWKEKKGTSFEKKVKTQRFLSNRGFEFDLIHPVLEGLEKGEEE